MQIAFSMYLFGYSSAWKLDLAELDHQVFPKSHLNLLDIHQEQAFLKDKGVMNLISIPNIMHHSQPQLNAKRTNKSV